MSGRGPTYNSLEDTAEHCHISLFRPKLRVRITGCKFAATAHLVQDAEIECGAEESQFSQVRCFVVAAYMVCFVVIGRMSYLEIGGT